MAPVYLDYRALYFALKKRPPIRCGGGYLDLTAGYYALCKYNNEIHHLAIFT